MKQPKHHFFLESRANKSGKRLIYLNFNYGFKEYDLVNKKDDYLTLKISTQWSIEKEYWLDKPEYRANKSYVGKYGKDLNNFLDKIERIVYNQLSIFRNEHDENPHPNILKRLVFEKLGRMDKPSSDYLITEYIENTIAKRSKLPPNSKKYWSQRTIVQYSNLKAHLKRYEKSTNTPLTFSNLSEIQYWDIFDNINKHHKETQGSFLKHNTIAKICKHLRTILRDASGNDIEIGFKWDKGEYKINEVTTKNNTGLDEEQLLEIFHTDTRHSREFDNARNYILFSSLTALRLGDMEQLYNCKVETFEVNNERFEGFKTKIRKAQDNSTELYAVIPLSKPLLKLIEENNGEFPKFPSRPVIRRQLKKFLKSLEFNNLVEYKERYYSQTDYEIETHHQWEVFTAHSCRYTFITNMSKLGVPENVVKNITHPTVKARSILAGYNLSTLEDNAYTLMTHLKNKRSKIYDF
ncbi:hypothetical protein [Winogradskyella sp. A2]|uniref:hypothetical protein n=1 Tax=Winogradskyella sp. A2 TaxID=3366944 RepID=UPI00398C565D